MDETMETLKKALLERALRTADNTYPPPRAPSGKSMSWMLDIRRLFLDGEELDRITDLFWDRMAEPNRKMGR